MTLPTLSLVDSTATPVAVHVPGTSVGGTAVPPGEVVVSVGDETAGLGLTGTPTQVRARLQAALAALDGAETGVLVRALVPVWFELEDGQVRRAVIDKDGALAADEYVSTAGRAARAAPVVAPAEVQQMLAAAFAAGQAFATFGFGQRSDLA